MQTEGDRDTTREWELRVEELQRRIDEICARCATDPNYRRTHTGKLARPVKWST
jgi:hypothetical protein